MSQTGPTPRAGAGPEEIAQATVRLRRGRLVAFPTETVYGLGADAFDEDAVRRVFVAKGRPASNPLIVHADDAEMARRATCNWPEEASRLARAFWPGPLTIVLDKADDLPGIVTAGGATVGVRVPDHPLTLALISAFGGPIVGPSANRSGTVSPTTAEHVREAFATDEVFILDGGPCNRGLESTVLDLTPISLGKPARVLRPGVVSADAIAAVLGADVQDAVGSLHGAPNADGVARSPGVQGPHYRPRAPLVVIGTPAAASPGDEVIELPMAAEDAGRAMYALIRAADAANPTRIAVVIDHATVDAATGEQAAVWAAIRERLARASDALRDGVGSNQAH